MLPKWTDDKLCQLEDDGQIVHYDVCSDGPYSYDRLEFAYIGFGVIHKIDGKTWNEPPVIHKHFYRKIQKNEMSTL